MNQKTLFKLEYDKIIALLEKEGDIFSRRTALPSFEANDRPS